MSVVVTGEHLIVQTFVGPWYPGVVMMPVLVQLLRVEMRREVTLVMRLMMVRCEVLSVLVTRVWQVIDTGRSSGVGRHRAGGRDHSQGPVEA